MGGSGLFFIKMQGRANTFLGKNTKIPQPSPPQEKTYLPLGNTSERKKSEAGVLERENGSAGNDGKRERRVFFSLPSLRVFLPIATVGGLCGGERVKCLKDIIIIIMHSVSRNRAVGNLFHFSMQCGWTSLLVLILK